MCLKNDHWGFVKTKLVKGNREVQRGGTWSTMVVVVLLSGVTLGKMERGGRWHGWMRGCDQKGKKQNKNIFTAGASVLEKKKTQNISCCPPSCHSISFFEKTAGWWSGRCGRGFNVSRFSLQTQRDGGREGGDQTRWALSRGDKRVTAACRWRACGSCWLWRLLYARGWMRRRIGARLWPCYSETLAPSHWHRLVWRELDCGHPALDLHRLQPLALALWSPECIWSHPLHHRARRRPPPCIRANPPGREPPSYSAKGLCSPRWQGWAQGAPSEGVSFAPSCVVLYSVWKISLQGRTQAFLSAGPTAGAHTPQERCNPLFRCSQIAYKCCLPRTDKDSS